MNRPLCDMEYGKKDQCDAEFEHISDGSAIVQHVPQVACILTGCSGKEVEWTPDFIKAKLQGNNKAARFAKAVAGPLKDAVKTHSGFVDKCTAIVTMSWTREDLLPTQMKTKLTHQSKAATFISTIFWVCVGIDGILLVLVAICSVKACKYINGDDDDEEDSYDIYY